MAKTRKPTPAPEPAEELLSMEERFPCTIAPELFEEWTRCRRKGDAEKIMILIDRSRPIVDRALKYGHVNDGELEATITSFFADRLRGQVMAAEELQTLSAKLKPSQPAPAKPKSDGNAKTNSTRKKSGGKTETAARPTTGSKRTATGGSAGRKNTAANRPASAGAAAKKGGRGAR